MAHQTRLARWSNCCCMKTEMVVVFTQCHYKRCYFIGHVNHIWPMKTVYFFPLLSSPFPVFVFLMSLSHFSHAATPQCGPSFQSCGLLLHTRTIQGQGRGGRPMAVRRCTLLVLARVNAKDVTDAQARPPWRRSCCAGWACSLSTGRRGQAKPALVNDSLTTFALLGMGSASQFWRVPAGVDVLGTVHVDAGC